MSLRTEYLTALRKLPLRGYGKAIARALADRANDRGVAWPSINRLAADVGCSRSTAKRALRTLRDHGLVELEGRIGTSSVVHLVHPGQWASIDDQSDPGQCDPGESLYQGQGDLGGGSGRPGGWVTVNRGVGQGDPLSSKEAQKEARKEGGAEESRPPGHSFEPPPTTDSPRLPAPFLEQEHKPLQPTTSPDIDPEVEAVMDTLEASPCCKAFEADPIGMASKLVQVFRDKAGTIEMTTGRPVPTDALTEKLEAKLFALGDELKPELVRLQALKAARYAAGDWHRAQGKDRPQEVARPPWRPPVPLPGPDPLARLMAGALESPKPANDDEVEAAIEACLEAWTL